MSLPPPCESANSGMGSNHFPTYSFAVRGWSPKLVIGGAPLSRRENPVVLAANQRSLPAWPLKIRRIAIIVFQFRVVAGTPYSLSI